MVYKIIIYTKLQIDELSNMLGAYIGKDIKFVTEAKYQLGTITLTKNDDSELDPEKLPEIVDIVEKQTQIFFNKSCPNLDGTIKLEL